MTKALPIFSRQAPFKITGNTNRWDPTIYAKVALPIRHRGWDKDSCRFGQTRRRVGEERMIRTMEKVVRISESDYRAIMRFDDDGGYAHNVVYEVFSAAAATFRDKGGCNDDDSAVGPTRETNSFTHRLNSTAADTRNLQARNIASRLRL